MAKESTALIDVNKLNLEKFEQDEAVLAELNKSVQYLPHVRVHQDNSTVVKEGKLPRGHVQLYYNRDRFADLGPQFDCLVIHYRPRAAWFVRDEAPLSYYNPASENFQFVIEQFEKGERGWNYGMEYLLWIPKAKEFAFFLMGTKSLRRESPNVKSHSMLGDTKKSDGKPITIKMKHVKWKAGDFWTVEALACDAPLEPPDPEEFTKVYNEIFTKPVDSPQNLNQEGSSDTGRAR